MPMGWRQAPASSRSSSMRAFLRWDSRQQSTVHHSSSSVGEQGVTNVGQAQVKEEKSYRDKIIDDYEAELREARLWAYIIGVLHVFSQFLAFCNLTWATVALLGAFLPDLSPCDFAFITCLLFIEAGRLASASFFLRFLMRPLAYRSQDPKKINHSEDGQYPASLRIRLSSAFVQFLLIAPGIVVPIIGHVLLRGRYPHTRNLESSLRIFYSLVAINSLIALVNLIYSFRAFKALNKPPEQSILRYFDTVLKNGMISGIVEADVFEFFRFAYTMLGGEYSRNVQPEAVAKNHKRLIEYLHAHRLGADALKVYLEAEDPFVQLAAVNMVGFWSDRTWGVGVPEKERKLPEELLTKLADKVSTGQVGWAATNSFGVLTSSPEGAHIVTRTCTSRNVRLPDRLAYLIDDSSSRSLSLVRTLVGFYEQLCENEQGPPEPFTNVEKNLVPKLEELAREAKVHRLRVQAAYLLLLVGKGLEEKVVLAIDPSKDAYWFESEMSMLELLRSHVYNVPPLQLPKIPVLEKDRKITVPAWAKPKTITEA